VARGTRGMDVDADCECPEQAASASMPLYVRTGRAAFATWCDRHLRIRGGPTRGAVSLSGTRSPAPRIGPPSRS